jgi:long-chain fatty acid transport protein
MYFGGGMYGTSGMGTDYGLTDMGPNMLFEGYSAIQFWQMAPTVAWNLNKQLTLGVSLNIDYQSVALKQAVYQDAGDNGLPTGTALNLDLSRAAQAFGYGVSLGALYDVNKQITVGFSYKSKQNFPDMEYQLVQGDIQGNPGFGMTTGCPAEVCPSGLYKLRLDFPAITALGVAYSPLEALTLSLDVKRIQWSDTLNVLTVTGPGGMELNMASGWDDQTIVALGVEYAVNQRLRLRMGYNQADAPIDAADVDSNLILPATSEKHYALGGDFRMSKFWDVGFHYSKASQNTLVTSNPMSFAQIGLEIDTFGINLGYRF